MNIASNYQYWIFDMDGTLTLAAHDFDAIREQLNIEKGTPILEAIENMPKAQATKATKKLHELEMDIAAGSQAQPDAHDMLLALQNYGCKLGILTRNAEDIAQVTLEAAGLGQFFPDEVIIGRDKCLPKPDPDGINHLMQRWQADRQRTVMVGDYLFDLQAGRNANVATVHFNPEGDFSWPQLTDHNITKLAQLTE